MPSFGDVTIADVIATMRPHLRARMPGQHGAHERDRRAVVEVERDLEVVIGDLAERTRLRTPVVEHEDVGLRARSEQRRRVLAGSGDVGGDRR